MSNGQNRRASTTVKRLAVVATAALLAGALLAPAPGSADPGGPSGSSSPAADRAPQRLTVAEVQSRLAVLNRQADVATEAYNTVRVQVHQAEARMTGLQADLQRQRTLVADLRDQIVGTALSDYTSTGGLSTSAAFLLSTRPSDFLNALATNAVVEHQQAGLLTELTQQQNQLGVQEQQASRELKAIGSDQAELSQRRHAVETKIKAASTLLASLKEKARLRVLARERAASQAILTAPSRGGERPPGSTSTPPTQNTPAPPASGRAAIAVQTALAQLGKPYVYGAAGPNSFDCSGLTMYSWAAAGVSLSHASSVQSGQGVAVSVSALQPGDLVFYYSPVSHVGMYIGNGQVVHAPHPGASVEIVPLTSMPISWARRVG